MAPGSFGCSEAVGRGGVEPPTFRFSGLTTALFAASLLRWRVVGVCRRLSLVADVAVTLAGLEDRTYFFRMDAALRWLTAGRTS